LQQLSVISHIIDKFCFVSFWRAIPISTLLCMEDLQNRGCIYVEYLQNFDLQGPPHASMVALDARACLPGFPSLAIEKVQPAHLLVMEKAMSFIDSHVICLCSKLDISETLEGGPLTLKQLADKVGGPLSAVCLVLA